MKAMQLTDDELRHIVDDLRGLQGASARRAVTAITQLLAERDRLWAEVAEWTASAERTVAKEHCIGRPQVAAWWRGYKAALDQLGELRTERKGEA